MIKQCMVFQLLVKLTTDAFVYVVSTNDEGRILDYYYSTNILVIYFTLAS